MGEQLVNLNKDFIGSIVNDNFHELDHLFHFGYIREWMALF